MSDTESILFHVHGDSMSAQSYDSGRVPSPIVGSEGTSKKIKNADATRPLTSDGKLERPPLPTGSAHVPLRSQSNSPNESIHKLAQSGKWANEDDNDEQSESIQFHFENPSRNMSFGSIPVDNASFTHAASSFTPSLLGRSGNKRTAQNPGVRNKSFRSTTGNSANVMHPSSATFQKQDSLVPHSSNQSIQFHVEKSSIDDDALKSTLRYDTKDRKWPSHKSENSCSTIFFEVEESSALKRGSIKASEKANAIPLKKTVVSNRLLNSHRERKSSNSATLHADVPLERATDVQDIESSVSPTVNPILARDIDTVHTHKMRPKISGDVTTTDISSPTPFVSYQGKVTGELPNNTANLLRVTSRGEDTNQCDSKPKQRPPQTHARQEDKRARLLSTMKNRIPTDQQRVSTTQIQSLSVHMDSSVENAVMQARLDTEHWRLFNSIQREEIETLIRRIIEARKADCISLLDKKRKKDQKSTPAMSAHSAQSLRAEQKTSRNIHSSGYHASEQQRKHVQDPFLRSNVFLSQTVANPVSLHTHSSAQKKRMGSSTYKDKSMSPPEFLNRSREAPEKLAMALGIAWPPRSRDELFFLTGARLTPQQRIEFYEAAKLQIAASENLHVEIWRNFEEGVKQKRTRNLTKRKSSRTFVLRKAFTLMDVEGKGEIFAEDLPALRKLLESESRHMEHVLGSETMLLAQSRKEQKLIKGAVDTHVRRPGPADPDVVSPAATCAMLYNFVINVIFPILKASGMIIFDFATVGLLVFGSLSDIQKSSTANAAAWRQQALQHFEALV